MKITNKGNSGGTTTEGDKAPPRESHGTTTEGNKAPPPGSHRTTPDSPKQQDLNMGSRPEQAGGENYEPTTADIPGAFLVPGPGRHDDDEIQDMASINDPEDSAHNPPPEAEKDSTELNIVANVVNEEEELHRLEEARQEGVREYLAKTAKVTGVPTESHGRSRLLLACGIIVVLAAAIIGILVPVLRSDNEGSGRDPDVLAEVHVLVTEETRTLPTYVNVETRLINGLTPITTGIAGEVECKASVCHEQDTNCVVAKMYEIGCCSGSDPACSKDEQCGDICDLHDDPHCRRRDSASPDCTNKDCFECKTDSEGNELFSMKEFIWDINCLNAGESIDDADGKAYRWAVFCGRVTNGPSPNLNYGLGDYLCAALDGRTQEITTVLPCQFIQLGECQCAPADVNTFGLPAPEKPCLTKEDCPFLCADAGEEMALNLCNAFSGLDWWRGQNFMEEDVFKFEEKFASTFEIYIKELDG